MGKGNAGCTSHNFSYVKYKKWSSLQAKKEQEVQLDQVMMKQKYSRLISQFQLLVFGKSPNPGIPSCSR